MANEKCNFINNYIYKIFKDIIYSNIYLNYLPYQIIISIIDFTRQKFNLDSKYMKIIKNIYRIKLNEYKDCLDDIKKLIKNIESNPQISRKNINYQLPNKLLFFIDDEEKNKEDKEENKINSIIQKPLIDFNQMEMKTPVINNLQPNKKNMPKLNLKENKINMKKTKKYKKLKKSKSFNDFGNIFLILDNRTMGDMGIFKCASFSNVKTLNLRDIYNNRFGNISQSISNGIVNILK